MKVTLTKHECIDRLLADKNARWSWEAAEAIVEYLEEFEDDTGEELEFDVVGIRCDFNEYGSAREAAEEYGYKFDQDLCEEDREKEAVNWLMERTTVLTLPSGGVVIMVF